MCIKLSFSKYFSQRLQLSLLKLVRIQPAFWNIRVTRKLQNCWEFCKRKWEEWVAWEEECRVWVVWAAWEVVVECLVLEDLVAECLDSEDLVVEQEETRLMLPHQQGLKVIRTLTTLTEKSASPLSFTIWGNTYASDEEYHNINMRLMIGQCTNSMYTDAMNIGSICVNKISVVQ